MIVDSLDHFGNIKLLLNLCSIIFSTILGLPSIVSIFFLRSKLALLCQLTKNIVFMIMPKILSITTVNIVNFKLILVDVFSI